MDSDKVIHGKYFPHIDGIRTIAVLSVVLYHIFGNLCPGGYVGVDIFFVISGYLITGGILKSLDKGTFSIKDFYERRIRRIIPAYLVLIAFVMLLSLILPPNLMERTFSASAFSSIFATNFFFPFSTGGYFDANAETNPLLHLWSLSVEEQFYIFTPVFLFFVYKFNRKFILAALVVVVALSLACSLYCNYRGGNNLNFYMLPTRTWELMAGSLFAYWNKVSPSIKSGGGAIRSAGLLGIILSITVCCLYNASTPFPGLAAIPPVVGALLMIRWGDVGISKAILESKPFVGIGKISYSLYLWHWPLIVYWKYISDEACNPWGLLGVFTLSMVMAWLSWRFVEMPIRLSKRWNFKRALLWVIIGCGSIGITSTMFIHTKFPDYWSKFIIGENYVESYWKGIPSLHYYSEAIDITKDMDLLNPDPEPCITLGADLNPCYLLWGDSHACALSSGLHFFSKEHNINGLFINRRAPCFSTEGKIHHYFNTIIKWLKIHPEFQTIIFINRWSISSGKLPNESDHPLHKRTHDEYSLFHDPAKNKLLPIRFESALREFCSQVKLLNRKLILISSIPEQGFDVPFKYYKSKILGKDSPHGIPLTNYRTRQQDVSMILKNIEKDGLAEILWIDDFFFKNSKYSRIANDKGFPLYIDDDHLNPTGAKELINYYNDELLRLLSPDKGNSEINAPTAQ